MNNARHLSQPQATVVDILQFYGRELGDIALAKEILPGFVPRRFVDKLLGIHLSSQSLQRMVRASKTIEAGNAICHEYFQLNEL